MADHGRSERAQNGKPLPAVARKVYNVATRAWVAKKGEVLDAWAVELCRIIGEPVQMNAADVEMGLDARQGFGLCTACLGPHREGR
ncbi:hypothetical protein ACQR1W_16085 [Bradyrhizobium sp. HKCCYLS1011]|uniref:hypothetical protein n=1 Tax=Bradyrhizobium sp. HKCCYLS1011 TaxID=3420733 RepID=UPI003EB93CCC